MVSTPGADTIVSDGNGTDARSRVGVVPTKTRSVMGKCTSKSHVLEFRR